MTRTVLPPAVAVFSFTANRQEAVQQLCVDKHETADGEKSYKRL